MSEQIRQGSLKLVNPAQIARLGALSVMRARIRTMFKFVWSISASAVLNPTLYLLSVGIGVGKLINAHTGGVDGVKYLTFLAPALLATAAIQSALDETVFPVLEGFKWNKSFYAMNSTPLSGRQIANGVLLAAMARTLFSVTIYGVIISLFGGFSSWRGWFAIPTALFAGAAFGAFIMGFAVSSKNEDSFFMILGRFIFMPLFLFSGTFYQLSSMPIFLRPIGWVSPLWHTTELGRWLTYGHHLSLLMVFVHFAYLSAMFAAGLRYTHKQFEIRLRK